MPEAVVAPPVEAPSHKTPRRPLPQSAPAGSAPSWRERFWFPVASLKELDPLRPTPVQIDGLSLVVWRPPAVGEHETVEAVQDKGCGWRIFLDACPHRLAPLSEGRLEPKTGCLQCAYHGWEFDTEGSCTRIPQATEAAAKNFCSSPRSSAIAFPVEVALDCLWAWLGERPPVGSPRELVKDSYLEGHEVSLTYTRDVPYGYDSLLENFVDVSHIPFAHHGMQGTRDDATPISMTTPKVAQTADGEHGDFFSFTFEDRTMNMDRQANFTLKSPFLFIYDGRMGDAPGVEEADVKRFRLSICCVPVSPGHSRMIILNTRRPEDANSFFSKLPKWLVHILSSRFIDSDLAFIHFQERRLRCAPYSPVDWSQSYYMPASSDRSIGAWRQWLVREGARCVLPGPASELPPSPARPLLLDRYSQHVAQCVHCQEGLRSIENFQLTAGAAGLAALVLDRLGLGPEPLWLGCQVLAVLGIAGAARLKQEFQFVDYEHYKT